MRLLYHNLYLEKNMEKVWVYWNQGWDDIPYMLQCCRDSIKKYASNDYEVVWLDARNVTEYLGPLPGVFEVPNFPLQTKADWIRLKLLQAYGGIWIDSTVFLNSNLKQFINSLHTNFFAFFRYPNKIVSNWFLYACKDSYVIQTWAREFCSIVETTFVDDNRKYFTKWKGSPNYFLMHRLFEKLMSSDEIFRKKISEVPFRCSSIPLLPACCYGYNNVATNEIISLVDDGYPMFKLSYSLREKDKREMSTIDILLKRLLNKSSSKIEHYHLPTSVKPFKSWNSDINIPDANNYSGIVTSEGDLRLSPGIKNQAYHVINSSSVDSRNVSQILIPQGKDDLYIRHSVDNKFEAPVRILTEKDNDCSERWRCLLQILPELPGLVLSSDFSKKYYQIYYSDSVPSFVHIEFQDGDASAAYFHVEDAKCVELNKNLLVSISKMLNTELIINSNGWASISVKSKSSKQSMTQIYLHTISYVLYEMKFE